MDRAIPEVNRITTQRQIMINLSKHKNALKNLRKSVDNELPIGYQFPQNKSKKT